MTPKISHIEGLKRNIAELQRQLQTAYIRIGELTCQVDDLKRYKAAVDDGKLFLGEEDESV